MDPAAVRRQLKELLIQELKLAHLKPEELDDDAILFGPEGLGFDSLDALQVITTVEYHYRLKFPEGERTREILQSIGTIADFVCASGSPE